MLQWSPRPEPGESVHIRSCSPPPTLSFNGAPGLSPGRAVTVELEAFFNKLLQWSPRPEPGESAEPFFWHRLRNGVLQ